MDSLTVPRLLERDKIWSRALPRLQLEIVVDNQTLADVANGISGVTNDFYKQPFDRIRGRLLRLYEFEFDYKASFLEPVDWRPREYNTAADHVANCVLDKGADICTLSKQQALCIMKNSIGLQVFCDGGYVQGKGAATFVVCAVIDHDGVFKDKIIGAEGYFMSNAHSAFHAEVTALDVATEFLVKLIGHH